MPLTPVVTGSVVNANIGAETKSIKAHKRVPQSPKKKLLAKNSKKNGVAHAINFQAFLILNHS